MGKLSRQFRANCLVQLCNIDPSKKHHKTEPPEVNQFRTYIEANDISRAFVIYEDPEFLKAHATGLDIDLVPVYRVHDTRHPDVPLDGEFRPSGLKIHPFLFRFDFSLDAVRPTLDFARAHNLFISIHMDDRVPDGHHIMSPQMGRELAKAYPDLTFIFHHAGSFAPPGRARLAKTMPDVLKRLERHTRTLVESCAAVMHECPNVFAETSILYNKAKAEIVASTMPHERILIGTDFPIRSAPRVEYQETALQLAGLTDRQIARIHENALKFPALEN